jgi:peroxiredoxin
MTLSMESSTLRVGSQAPQFELLDERGMPFNLQGQVGFKAQVLIFFPSVWGMMCAVEMSTFREMFPNFADSGIKLVAIDTNSPMSNAAWKDQMRLQFPMLSDFDGKVSNRYGILCGEEGYMRGRSNRAIFVIDHKIIVRYIWVADDPSYEPDYDEVLREALKVAQEI